MINKEILDSIDLTELSTLINDEEAKNYFLDIPGREHYKLLSYLSNEYTGEVILDIGTYKGCSSIALSYNTDNKVFSFDIKDYKVITRVPSNVEYIIGDITSSDYNSLLISSKLIMLDTFHDGNFESKFYYHLKNIKWKGTLILDDIYLNDSMKSYWEGIVEEKIDLTKYGHYTGTGLVKIL